LIAERKKDAAEALTGAESARNRVYLRCPRYGLPRGNENDGDERGDRREAPKDLHGSQAVPPEKLHPQDDDPGTPNHRIDGFRACSLRDRDLFDQELQVGLDRRCPRVYVVASRGGDRLA